MIIYLIRLNSASACFVIMQWLNRLCWCIGVSISCSLKLYKHFHYTYVLWTLYCVAIMTKLLLDTDAVLLVYWTPLRLWDKSNCYVSNMLYCITAGGKIVQDKHCSVKSYSQFPFSGNVKTQASTALVPYFSSHFTACLTCRKAVVLQRC